MKRYHDCMEVREEFSAYLDGELTAEEREGLEVHLAGCAECLRELDTMKRVDVAYRGLPAVAAPDGFEANVREAVRTGRPGSEPVRRPVPRWMGPLVAMATAAAVLIVSVIVLEVRQGSAPQMQMADAPMEFNASDTATLMQTSPEAASTPDQGPAGGGAAWDSFARAPESAAAPAVAAAPPSAEKAQASAAGTDGAWENFARAPEASAPVEAGREDSGGVLADALAAGAKADDGMNAEERARAEVIGAPEQSAEGARDELSKDENVPPPNLRANVGEVVSRRVLRSFKVRADGAWVEAGYAGEPTTDLKRGSDALNQVMQQHPNEIWDTLLDRAALQIFKLDGAWYALEGKAAEQ